MKKYTAIFVIYFISTLFTYSQTIVSMNYSPANPTEADSITVIVENMFTSGGCEGTGFLNSISGNEIIGGGIHCIGALAVICTDYDTVVIPPLAAGHYTFIFILSTADAPACVPGIIPLTYDSLHLVILPFNSVSESVLNSGISVYPNPSSGSFTISKSTNELATLRIISPDGRLIMSYELSETETAIDTKLSAGIYTLLIEGNKSGNFRKLVITD
jgi:hypothetical protein